MWRWGSAAHYIVGRRQMELLSAPNAIYRFSSSINRKPLLRENRRFQTRSALHTRRRSHSLHFPSITGINDGKYGASSGSQIGQIRRVSASHVLNVYWLTESVMNCTSIELTLSASLLAQKDLNQYTV